MWRTLLKRMTLKWRRKIMIDAILSFLIDMLTKWRNRDSLKTLGSARSPQWSKVRKEWLRKHPFCAVCGKLKNVVPHHKHPFHIYPELELSELNLVSLCES